MLNWIVFIIVNFNFYVVIGLGWLIDNFGFKLEWYINKFVINWV